MAFRATAARPETVIRYIADYVAAVFYFFGRKGQTAKSYPAPSYPLVIEPFAGSMGYTLHHRPPFAIGIDADEDVVDLWHRLTAMTVREIEEFPGPIEGHQTSDLWHILAAASDGNLTTGYRTATASLVTRFERQRRLALRHHLHARRNVLYCHGDYSDAPDVEATWFIDPPYERVAGGYRHRPDSGRLERWIASRRGQVIVCEGEGASWLKFTEHSRPRSVGNTGNAEMIWTQLTSKLCKHCSEPFNRRADAVFCSDRCRVRAHRLGPGRS